jgi:(E)-4-hydroxy-3-methylbut-2-enyl-diphosphate synthase
VSILSMCMTARDDIEATAAQIERREAAGCDFVRVAVPDL